jgi:DNA topoisomerase IB
LNNCIRTYLGEEFTAEDFRTWGGTLTAAVELARHAPPETEAEARRRLANVMRKVGEKLGNTPAVGRCPTSARRSWNSIWTGERSRISARGICA